MAVCAVGVLDVRAPSPAVDEDDESLLVLVAGWRGVVVELVQRLGPIRDLHAERMTVGVSRRRRGLTQSCDVISAVRHLNRL